MQPNYLERRGPKGVWFRARIPASLREAAGRSVYRRRLGMTEDEAIAKLPEALNQFALAMKSLGDGRSTIAQERRSRAGGTARCATQEISSPRGGSARERKAPLLSEVVEAYCREQEEAGRWSRDVPVTVRGSLRGALESIGDRPVTEVTREHVRAYRRHLQATPTIQGRQRTPSGINHALGYLSAVFRFAGQERWIEFNPVAGLRVLDGRHRKDLRLAYTRADLTALFAQRAPEGEEADTMAWLLIPRLMVCCGLRNEEAAALRAGDLHEEGDGQRCITLGADFPRLKTPSAVRTVPVPRQVAHLFDGLFQKAGAGADAPKVALFHGILNPNYRGDRTTQLSRFWNQKYQVTQGVTEVSKKSLYSLRHSYQSLLVEADTPIHAIKTLMGHADADVTTGTYGARLTTAKLREYVERVDWSFLL